MLEKMFIEDLLTEFRFSEVFPKIQKRSLVESMLKEEHGAVPNHDLYVNEFGKYCARQVKKGIYNFTLPEDFFANVPDCFFESCKIKVNIELKKNVRGSIDSRGGYNPAFSSFDSRAGKFRVMAIGLDIVAGEFSVRNCCENIFAHEILHAYQDCCMKRKNPTFGLVSSNLKTNYYKNQQSSPTDTKMIEKLRVFLYFMNPNEINVFAGTLRKLAYYYSKKTDTPEVTIEKVRKSDAFGPFRKIDKVVNELQQVTNPNTQEIVLRYWNENGDKPQKNYNSLMKLLVNRNMRIQQRVSRILSKQIADNILEMRLLGGNFLGFIPRLEY